VIHKSNRHLRTLLTLVFASFVSITLIPSSGHAAPEIDSIHFLIPGGAGGGWDGTARGTGEAL
jgi:putative tricarboxylic transport membrane protein